MQFSLPLLFLIFFSCTACQTDLTTGSGIDEPVNPIATDTPGNPVTTDELSVTTLRLVNEVRQAGCRCGNKRMPAVAPLTLEPRLTSTARTHSADQAQMDRMQHQGSDGKKVGDRLSKTGYRWRAVAENVAWNYADAEAVMEAWLSSPGHCKNIMGEDYTHMGVAQSNRYWTQVFAAHQ